MKKNVLSLAGLCVVLCTACLEEQSPNFLRADGAINNAAGAEAAVIGLYSAMQQGAYYGESYLLASEGHTDNASTGGYQVLSLDQIGNREMTGANLISENIWTAIYRVIANANRILQQLPAVEDLDAIERKHLEGEVRTIRALAHFDLLRLYGEHWKATSAAGIPLIELPQGIRDQPVRASVAASYQFILGDLNQAASMLAGVIRDKAFVDRNTVHALLARVYLYQGDMTRAADFAGRVIAEPSFRLLEANRHAEVFRTRLGSESVFELLFDSQNRSGYNSATYSRADAIRSELNYLASRNLEEFFLNRPGDVRRSLLDFSSANDLTIQPDGRTWKYRGEVTKDNSAPIIRLAEMLLIRAEALGPVRGLADLNLLRQARGLTNLNPTSVTTSRAYTTAILEERRAEFNFEGHRYFDLARTGRTREVLGVADYRAIFPIPNREITANPNLKQNSGY